MSKMERATQTIKYFCKNLKVSEFLLSVGVYIRTRLVIAILDQKLLSLQKST